MVDLNQLEPVGHVRRDVSEAHMHVNLAEGSPLYSGAQVDSLIARIRDLERIEAGVKWRPIEEAPKGEVLLWHPTTKSRMPLQSVMRVGWAGEWPNRPATHWMPLPAPPADGEAREALTGGKDD